uniref:Aftiphilin n=1 Tax=Latimeria chalumnae TaxID=7897 RepID=H3B5C2_LATCH
MEPDIIRMYSSSPPPLDDGAEDDDDEFGEFGGFSGAGTSSVGFVDIDSPEFTNSKEDFLPQNHFMPIEGYSSNVDAFADFNSVNVTDEKDLFTDFSRQIGGHSTSLASSIDNEVADSISAKTIIDSTGGTVIEKTKTDATSECLTTNILSRTDLESSNQEQKMESCNGEKLSCPEIITNGFAPFDSINPQGTEDLDSISDSKGLKTISTHSTELSLDSMSSPAEHFADFTTFLNVDKPANSIQTETMEHKVSGNLDEGKKLNIQGIIMTDSINGLNIADQKLAGEGCTNEGAVDTGIKLGGDSETDAVVDQKVSNGECDVRTIDHSDSEDPGRYRTLPETVMQTVVGTESTEQYVNVKLEVQNEEGVFKDSLSPEQTEDSPGSTQIDTTETNKFGYFGPVKSITAAAEEFSFSKAAPSDATEDEFGDFGTVHNALTEINQQTKSLPTTDAQEERRFDELSMIDDFGDFGEACTVNEQASESEQPKPKIASVPCENEEEFAEVEIKCESDFGDFDTGEKSKDEFAAFQDNEEFADFSSASGNPATEWNAFGEDSSENSSWAAFGEEQAAHFHSEDTWQSKDVESSPTSDRLHTMSCTLPRGAVFSVHSQPTPDELEVSLLSRLERVFQACFPPVAVLKSDEEITSLKPMLEPGDKQTKRKGALAHTGELLDLWMELQDIHDAYGLRYQWGGSHSNKKLLCSLGIDTRNILFTGQKKQPVIVPMYAAGLGMLEPTKEPLKPISAAEKIASIGQASPLSPEMNTCTPDQTQESLPPVQFDWSSSGLTNPLDASGGSSLLNLDFFGPVDDTSSSSTTTIPGVDPELYELTTAKLENTSTSSRVVDAFARLMSTVEKTSTSTRKPKKEENLSKEAAKVIASLPDLSFMHAKVLMFPATLTPSTSSQEKVD